MTQTGYCPRGPFCAFAHVEQEIRVVEDMPSSPTISASSFNQPPADGALMNISDLIEKRNSVNSSIDAIPRKANNSIGSDMAWTNFAADLNHNVTDITQNLTKSNLGVDVKAVPGNSLLMPRQVAGIKALSSNVPYSKAPGSERSVVTDQSVLSTTQQGTFGSVGSNSAWPLLSVSHNAHGVGSYSSTNSSPSNLLPRQMNSLNSDAQPFYPADETVDSVVGNALKDLDETNLEEGNLDKNISTNIWAHVRSSSHDNSFSSSLFPISDPVNIPQEQSLRENNTPHSLHGGLSSLSSPAMGGMEFPSAGSMPGGRYFQQPPVVGSANQQGLSSSMGSGFITANDMERMQHKCKQWEDSWNQAKAACDAWKREATDANERARLSEERCRLALEQYKFLENKLNVNASGDSDKKCQFLHQNYSLDDLRKFPVATLKQLQTRYKTDLERIEKIIWEMLWKPQQKS